MHAKRIKKHIHVIFACKTVFLFASQWLIKNCCPFTTIVLFYDLTNKTCQLKNFNVHRAALLILTLNQMTPCKVKGLLALPTPLKSHTPVCSSMQPSATSSSLFWFTGPSGWGPMALTSPCIKSHGQLPAHKLKQAVHYLCIEKWRRAEGW